MTMRPLTLRLWSLKIAPYTTVNVYIKNKVRNIRKTSDQQHDLKDLNGYKDVFRSSAEISKGEGGAVSVFSLSP